MATRNNLRAGLAGRLDPLLGEESATGQPGGRWNGSRIVPRMGVVGEHQEGFLPTATNDRGTGLTPALNWNTAFHPAQQPQQSPATAHNDIGTTTPAAPALDPFRAAFQKPAAPAAPVGRAPVNPNAIAAGMGLHLGVNASPASAGGSIKAAQTAQALDPFRGMDQTSQGIKTPYGFVQPKHGELSTDQNAQQQYVKQLPQIGQEGTPANQAFVDHYHATGDPQAAFQRAIEAHRRAESVM